MTRRTLTLLVGALLVAASVAGAGVVLGATGGTDSAQTPDRSIAVGGSGSAETQPDKAVLRVAVEATAENASAARDAVATDYAAMKSALLELGLSADQIRTVGYDLYEDERAEKRARETREKREGGERSVTTVYRASHDVAVEINDTDRVGAVLDAAVDGGATVNGVQFTLSEETRDRLRQQALREAMDDARTEAETIATSADLQLAGVHAVHTVDRGVVHRRVEYAATADAGGASTEVSPGPVRVTAAVQVTYNATA